MNKGSQDWRQRISITLAAILFLTIFIYGPSVAQEQQRLTEQELEVIVAPIALYPDELLSNILTASTVPSEIVQAALYLRQHEGSVKDMPYTDWDPSVKALLLFPDVIYKMDKDLSWTQTLGFAVSHQLEDVMKAIQSYRQRAHNANNLTSNGYQRVIVRDNIIEISSLYPNVIYVPVYDPLDAVYWGYPCSYFSAGIGVSDWWYYRRCNWQNYNICVNQPFFSNFHYYPGNHYYSLLNNHPNQGGNTWHPVPTSTNVYHPTPTPTNVYHGGSTPVNHNLTPKKSLLETNGGALNINTGGSSNPTNSGNIYIKSGTNNRYNSGGGGIHINTGGGSTPTNSGNIYMKSGSINHSNTSGGGGFHINTGGSSTPTNSGNVFMKSGSNTHYNSGSGGGFRINTGGGGGTFHSGGGGGGTFHGGGGGGGTFHGGGGGGTFHGGGGGGGNFRGGGGGGKR